jgi:glycosyltransferase involved in cell wall biosynthesis
MANSGLRLTLLTIAIPTYNRAENLNNLLLALASLKGSQGVAILVSDNCSTDHTQSVVHKWQEFYGSMFSSIRNASNLGFDQNVVSLYRSAKTDYIWFLSDEDLPELDELDQTLAVLSEGKFGLLIASQSTSPQIGKTCVEVDLCPYQPTKNTFLHKIDEDLEVSTPDNRAALILMASQISTSILRTGIKIPTELKHLGGLPQSYIGHLALLTYPYARISGKTLTYLAAKNDVSDWFLESCFTGSLEIYSRPELELPMALRNQIINSNVRFGISILKNQLLRGVSLEIRTSTMNSLLAWNGLDLNNRTGIHTTKIVLFFRFMLLPIGRIRTFLSNKLISSRQFLINLIRVFISSQK